jgi:O-antigen/teichoic acid export membrane protein
MIVAGILSKEEFGVVTVALIGPTLITYIRDLGIDQATIKYATQYKTENNTEKLKNVITRGTVFEVILGTVFTAISLLLSGLMANILERPTIVSLIQIASFIILADALLKAAQSAFIGYEKMKHYSITLILHSTLKTGLMVILVTLSFGPYGAIIGNAISYLSAGLISIALLYLTVIKKLQKQAGQLQLISTAKTMLTFGLPLSIAMRARILGLIAAHLSSGVPSLLISLWWINKNYNATVDWKSSTKILAASAFSAVLTYLVLNQINLASWISLLVGAAVFLGTYMITTPFIGAIDYSDTKNLKDLLKSLGPLGPIVNPLLYPIEKITSRTQKRSVESQQ